VLGRLRVVAAARVAWRAAAPAEPVVVGWVAAGRAVVESAVVGPVVAGLAAVELAVAELAVAEPAVAAERPAALGAAVLWGSLVVKTAHPAAVRSRRPAWSGCQTEQAASECRVERAASGRRAERVGCRFRLRAYQVGPVAWREASAACPVGRPRFGPLGTDRPPAGRIGGNCRAAWAVGVGGRNWCIGRFSLPALYLALTVALV